MGGRYRRFVSGVSWCRRVSGSMYLWTWHCLTPCPPSLLLQSCSVSLCSAFAASLQSCGREHSVRPAPIGASSWGINTSKWKWCTEQVKEDKENEEKKKDRSLQAVLLPANKLCKRQFKFSNGSNICKVQSALFLFIAVPFMIYLTSLSYFMSCFKTTRQREFLLWQQWKKSMGDI